MDRHPTPGAPVRLRTQNFEPIYYSGDRGTVLSGPHHTPGGGLFYVLQLERDGPGAAGIIVHAEEFEVEHSSSNR